MITPFEAGKLHKPTYYRVRRPSELVREGADIWDVLHAFEIDDPQLAMAAKYLVRAGRKPGAAREDDLAKALECIQRSLALNAAASASAPSGEVLPTELIRVRAAQLGVPYAKLLEELLR